MTKKVSQKRVIGFLFKLWRISPVLTWTMIITQIITTVLTSTIAPIFVSKLLASIANGTATMDDSLGLLIIYASILFIGSVVIVRISLALIYIVERRMEKVVTSRVFKHLTEKSLGYHANNMSGRIVSDSGKLNGSISNFWDALTFNAIPIITTLIAICTALSFIMWQYALVLAILALTIISIIIKIQTVVAPNRDLVAKRHSRMIGHLSDAIGNISSVKAFAREKNELSRFKKLFNSYARASMKQMKAVIISTGVMSIMMTLMNIAAFTTAIFATEYHIANIGAIYLVVSYTLNVVGQIWQVSNMTRTYIRIVGDASPMIATLDEPIEIVDIDNPKELVINEAKIEFDKMSFTHDGNKKALFDGFSLTINPGEQVGLIGRSGSGKTSLTRLLLRFSDIKDGQIKIDGQDITQVKQSELREAIAYVAQEPSLFHRSIRENIAYGKPSATEQEIFDAAEQANATEFIESLPKGFDTTIGERGVKLSGGQRQRIAIARAILKNAPILVLDEATSALDSESEQLIQDALAKLMVGRTSIVIAHRLSTISRLNRIVVMDHGKITEQGTHGELMANDGIYAKLWSRQSGGFIKD
ncbi:MAG: ABC transporter ATP-binding protein [Candidatus Saccharibacteria bacterium]